MPTRKRNRPPRKRSHKIDPVEIQLSIKWRRKVDKKGNPIRITKALLDDAVQYWAHEGESPEGFDIAVTRWRNPARVTAKGREWRNARTDDQRNCDMIRRMLRSGKVNLTYG